MRQDSTRSVANREARDDLGNSERGMNRNRRGMRVKLHGKGSRKGGGRRWVRW